MLRGGVRLISEYTSVLGNPVVTSYDVSRRDVVVYPRSHSLSSGRRFDFLVVVSMVNVVLRSAGWYSSSDSESSGTFLMFKAPGSRPLFLMIRISSSSESCNVASLPGARSTTFLDGIGSSARRILGARSTLAVLANSVVYPGIS